MHFPIVYFKLTHTYKAKVSVTRKNHQMSIKVAQILPKNVEDLGKIIVAKGFKKLLEDQ